MAGVALEGAEAGVGQAEEGVHFAGGVFVAAAGVVDEEIIGLADAAGGLHAEAADRRGQGEDPDGGADGHVVIGGKVEPDRLDGHGPAVHPVAAAPPEAERARGPLGGADLIRRKERENAFACTFQLLLTHDGRKMGKTEKGALWLDPAKTSPYDFYQYWRNVDDQDVEKCLGLLTFLPMDEVRRLGALKDSQINEAKKVLAYEVTKLVHGEEEAEKAQEAAASLFGGAAMGGSIPTTEITAADLEKDARVTTLLVTCGLAPSNSAARRLVQGGGVSLGEDKVTDVNAVVTADMIPTDGLMLRSGKKKFHRIVLK